MRKLFGTKVSETALSVALFIFRVGVASLMMVQHGLDKLKTFSSKSARWPDPFGVGHPTSLSLTIFAEFFCAAFIILGLFTRLAAIPLVVAMGVALFVANHGRFFGPGENAGLFLICFLAILITGPGRFSLDRFIGK
jgi:putative oxidoreductase